MGISAKALSFAIGATTYAIVGWEFTPTCELLDDTDSKSSGNEEWIAGIMGGSGTITARYDPNDNPITVMMPGTEATLLLGLNADEVLSVTVIVESLPITTTVRGHVEIKFNFKATAWDLDGTSGLTDLNDL